MSVSSHHFIPTRNLPQWNRVGFLGKCVPRRPLLQPLPAPPPPPAGRGAVRRAESPPSSFSFHPGADPRVSSLERNIQFLQEQHRDTLEKLHAEVDHLRRENKELQYKMIMDPPQTSRKGKAPTHGEHPGSPTKGSKAPIGTYPEVSPQDMRRIPDQSQRKGRDRALKADLIASLHPLRIHSSLSRPPRAPTLPECEDIIRQLSAARSSQSLEILRMKTLLNEIVLSRKVSSENYILAKSYLVDDACKSTEVKNFQKLGLEILPEKKYGVILPALSSTTAERQRRNHAAQRNHFKRTLT